MLMQNTVPQNIGEGNVRPLQNSYQLTLTIYLGVYWVSLTPLSSALAPHGRNITRYSRSFAHLYCAWDIIIPREPI